MSIVDIMRPKFDGGDIPNAFQTLCNSEPQGMTQPLAPVYL